MLHLPRQTVSVDLPTDIPSSIVSIVSSIVSAATDFPSSIPSSDPSSQITSAPSSQPPSSIETTPVTPPPSSESDSPSQTPSSDTSSTAQITSSTPVIDTSSPTSTPLVLSALSLAAASSSSVTQPTNTQNLTTIVTLVNGQSTTFTSVLPTNLANDTPSASNTRRTALIAGTTAGLFAFILLLLVCVFAYRKHQLRKSRAVSGQRREGRGLLLGGEFDDDDAAVPQTRSVGGASATFIPRAVSPAASLLRSRTSESGSIFREEVWPPPGFSDPIAKRSSQVDLSRIVDDVMGPMGFASAAAFGSGRHALDPSSSTASGSIQRAHERGLTDASIASAQSQLSSSTMGSNVFLPGSNASFAYNDPFAASSSQKLVSSPNESSLPPGALRPITPGMNTPLIPTFPSASSSSSALGFPPSMSAAGSSHSITSYSNTHSPSTSTSTPTFLPPSGVDSAGTPTSQSQPQLRPTSMSTQPKKSSPLARALTGDAKALWIGRHVKTPSDGQPPTPSDGNLR